MYIKQTSRNKKRKNNELILVTAGNRKLYFTSVTKASYFLGIAAASARWAMIHKNVLINDADEEVTIETVDGSEIPYKMININD